MPATQPNSPPDILRQIVADKKVEIQDICVDQQTKRPGHKALIKALAQSDQLNVIAEVKRKSPSAGVIAELPAPQMQAQSYVDGGAVAVSVLTDHKYFGGSLDDLHAVRAQIKQPVLRKDFMIDDRQFYQASAAGADIVLLIAAILEPAQAWEFHELADSLGLETIFEIHSEQEYEPFSGYNWPIIGINNRDLHIFKTDLATTHRIAPQLPQEARIISESGFHSFEDIDAVAKLVDGYLIGESLARSPNPAEQLRQWQKSYGNS